jgi:hypothetical protein
MVAHAVLALSVVAALGLVLGSLGFRGIRLGAAGVMFAGLLLGQTGLHIDQKIPAERMVMSRCLMPMKFSRSSIQRQKSVVPVLGKIPSPLQRTA